MDIYSESNAYYYDAPFKRTERPGQRDSYSGATYPGYGHPYGQTSATVKEMNHRELVLGDHSRSCGQWVRRLASDTRCAHLRPATLLAASLTA